jgi:hypothetical protein
LRGFGSEDDERHSADQKQEEVCAVMGLTHGETAAIGRRTGPTDARHAQACCEGAAWADRPLPAGCLALGVCATIVVRATIAGRGLYQKTNFVGDSAYEH